MILVAHLKGHPVARIIDDGWDDTAGYFWEGEIGGRWEAMSWYRTIKGAKIAAARYYGERMVWE